LSFRLDRNPSRIKYRGKMLVTRPNVLFGAGGNDDRWIKQFVKFIKFIK